MMSNMDITKRTTITTRIMVNGSPCLYELLFIELLPVFNQVVHINHPQIVMQATHFSKRFDKE
jgi:hypothetical protein